jgi:hypothetical protein
VTRILRREPAVTFVGMIGTEFADPYHQVQPRVSNDLRNMLGNVAAHRFDARNCTHVQDASTNEAADFDEASPIGPAPPTDPKSSRALPGQDLGVQRQLVELIHVLRRIALARRVALESTKVAHRASVDRAGCSTQQVIDLLLLAKSMAAQAIKISVAKPYMDGGNVKQQDLQHSDRFHFRNELFLLLLFSLIGP